MYNSIYELSLNATYEKVLGTLRYTLTISYNRVFRWFTQSFFHMVIGSLNISVSIIIMSIVFRNNISLVQFLVTFLIAFIAMISICNYALLIGSLAVYLRNINFFLNIIGVILMLSSGIFFSTNLYPSFLGLICRVLPLHNSILAVRYYYTGMSFDRVIIYIIMEMLLSILYLGIGILMQKYLEKRCIKNGNLELF